MTSACGLSGAFSRPSGGTKLDLSNWQGQLRPVIGKGTLLQLSLPGVHDALTTDSSADVSDDANDIPVDLAEVLHMVGDVAGVGDYMRNQSITQGLLLPDMLDAGVRFIDFRITWTAGPEGRGNGTYDWYGLHMVETKLRAVVYLAELRAWLEAHPGEFVVVWFSHHGSPCDCEYPGASVADQNRFWRSVEAMFAGWMWDSTVDVLNSSSIDDVLDRGHRVLFFVSAPSFEAFTGGSPRAYDGCRIDNFLGQTNANWSDTLDRLETVAARRAKDSALDQFLLMSMAPAAPGMQQFLSGVITFFPEARDLVTGSCADSLGIPGMSEWCPMHCWTLPCSENYYIQKALDEATLLGPERVVFPNAIYLNAVDHGGCIRTGTGLFGPAFNNSLSDTAHESSCYAYVATLVLYNVGAACAVSPAAACADLIAAAEAARALFPLQSWSDPYHGRFPLQ